MAGQITGAEAVLQALTEGVAIDRVLVDREKETQQIRQLCLEREIPLDEGSTNDLWRMSAAGHVDALALIGRFQTDSIDELMSKGGTIWFFDGVTYSTNLGFAIRAAEVSGANGVVINVAKTHEERRTIRRASMRADRFIPVIYSSTEDILQCAKEHNLTIISAEDVGDILLVVGAEREGVSQATLDASDYIVRLPMDGFVPSYNLQVAVSVLTVEALKQRLT
jgi:tRNA G18 (ribose-2'-O)-methylase SpoU